MTVSLAMLVKDPPLDRLAALLDYVRPVVSDVVIAVDDKTSPTAASIMGYWPDVTLKPFTWANSFAAARNVALPLCKGDWTLVLDPDELPTVAMMNYIKSVDTLSVPTRAHLFWTRNFWGGSRAESVPSDWHVRLFRTNGGRFYRNVHELVEVKTPGGWQTEDQYRGSIWAQTAPEDSYLIHSKSSDELEVSTSLYATMT